MALWSIILSILLVLVTVPHSVEDFQYGVPEQFGLGTLAAGAILGVAYAVQIGAAALVARRRTAGHWASLALALIWFFGAVFDHLDDVLFQTPYRAGLPSKALEVGIMLVALAWAVVSGWALARQR